MSAYKMRFVLEVTSEHSVFEDHQSLLRLITVASNNMKERIKELVEISNEYSSHISFTADYTKIMQDESGHQIVPDEDLVYKIMVTNVDKIEGESNEQFWQRIDAERKDPEKGTPIDRKRVSEETKPV